jgi:hypothetical protein
MSASRMRAEPFGAAVMGAIQPSVLELVGPESTHSRPSVQISCRPGENPAQEDSRRGVRLGRIRHAPDRWLRPIPNPAPARISGRICRPRGQVALAGSFTYTRKAERSTRCRAITHWPRSCTPSRCGRHCRGPPGLAVSHQPEAQRHRLDRAADATAGRLAHDPPARGGGRHRRANRKTAVPRTWPRMPARARPGSMIGGKNASRRRRWREFGCDQLR